MLKAGKILTIGFVCLSLVFAVGCETGAGTGAAVGSLAGAGVGQLAGKDTEATLIGAAVGGGLGYIIGNEADKQKAAQQTTQLAAEMNTVTVFITNSNGSIVPVKLRKYGPGYLGTRGEYYSKLPSEDQLRPVYGF
jgi:outer membrane lipoprotein SlyB